MAGVEAGAGGVRVIRRRLRVAGSVGVCGGRGTGTLGLVARAVTRPEPGPRPCEQEEEGEPEGERPGAAWTGGHHVGDVRIAP